ncbi:MAG: Gfo/Idh/MocA family oxidoreductase [Kiritimatiellae bacterium]|nr:Gfo/Idh/MocA family oxidoreductase [Kiritimatiellia bacterium]
MNRREFIKAGAGAFFIASAGRAIGAGAASNRVRLAIIGCHEKGRGFVVMKEAMKVPGVEIACVCDVDSRAREFAADFVLKATGVKPRMEADLRKVVNMPDIDGVVSETPDHIHAYSAIAAMRAGKAVYVEKPCCFCPEEGQILMRVAKETGAVLQVGNQRRASLVIRAALDWLWETGAIGEMRWGKAWYMNNRASIGRGRVSAVPEWLDWDLWQGPAPRTEFRDNVVHYNWHWFRRWGTSEMGNNAPHFADISRWALGLNSFPESVTCSGERLFGRGDDYEWPDTFNASFKYPNGKFITFELASHCNWKPYMDTVTGAMVYGTKGSVFFGPSDTVQVFDGKSKLIKEWTADGVVKEQMTISTTNPTAGLNVLHLTNFVECLRAKNAATYVPADQGVMSSVLPLLANIATDAGETIHLDPATGRLLGGGVVKGWAREYQKGWELA